MLRIGFTGNRNGLTTDQYNQVKNLMVGYLSKNKVLEVHHGDCLGADTLFHNICKELSDNIIIVIHPPIDNKLRSYCQSNNILEPKDYLVRNKDIVLTTNSLIACPASQTEELRSGTWATIRYARKLNKTVILF